MEIFADMIDDGNLDEKEFMNEYYKVIDMARFLSTSLFHIKRNSNTDSKRGCG